MRRARAWAAGVLLLLAAGIAGAAPAAPGASREAELRELRGRIEKLQAELAAAERSSGEATGQLRQSARALTEAHRALFALTQQRRALEAELASIAGKTRALRAGIAEQEALAGRLLRLQHRQGATDRLRLALEGKDAASAARHIQYYGYIQRARAGIIGELRQKADELAGLEREAAARRDALQENEAAQEREAQRLKQERAERAAVVAKLSGEIARGRREIGRLKRDETRLAKLVERIARALAAKPAEAAPRKGRSVDQVADSSLSAQSFESLKGRLRLPVRGELVHRFGTPREEAGVQWKGVFIRAVTGETVRAVADGRVVYADWLRGFGNLLILDHGRGFMSLYANNEGLVRQVGDRVRAGDAIGQVGNTSESGDSGLYFELRRDGKPFDPMRWVAQ